MSARPRSRRLSRLQKVWLSTLATMLGLAALTLVAMWVIAARDTDLVDPSVGVTSVFKDGPDLPVPPIHFVDVAAELGLAMRHGPGPRSRSLPEDTGSGVAWGDYDGDGDWDLYLVNFAGPLGSVADPGGSNRLFRNDGGRFVDVTAAAGVGDLEGFGMGATFADYDGDGDEDLYVTNRGPNRLFRNRGDGTFDEVAGAAGVDDPSWSTGVAWGDFDRDGHLDLFVCNYIRFDAEETGVDLAIESGAIAHAIPFTLNPNSFDAEPNRLYRNRGDGTFEDVALRCDVQDPDGRSLAATFCDLDGDGWLDLYVNNDVSTNRLYRNLGEQGGQLEFADLSSVTGTADPRGSMGLSVAELGAMSGGVDGRPDLFITHWVAQENALYLSVSRSDGGLEYRDKIRAFHIGEVSIDTVGWGSALVDLDQDGRLDLVVVNGSTLEQRDDPGLLVAEPMFLFWNAGRRFVDVAAQAGTVCAGRHRARGLAAADFDGDGDIDLAVGINRGQPLLLRNDTAVPHRSVRVLLRGPATARFGARIELEVAGSRQVQWFGADVTYLGMHAPESLFGLGQRSRADELRVYWADGRRSRVSNVDAGRVVVRHVDALPVRDR